MEVSASIQALSQFAATAAISGLWQGLLLTAMVSVCLKLVPRTSANLRFLTWLALFLVVLFLPFFSLLKVGHSGVAAAAPQIATGAPLELDPRWALAIGAVWLMASLTRAGILARSVFHLRAIRGRATPIQPEFVDAASRGTFRSPVLCSSPDVDQPCVIGFFAPRILVPGWLLEKATPPELKQVVLHESAHLRRFDDWTNLFQKLALVLFPLSAGLLWADRRLGFEREEACDECVVRATRSPYEYAACLANLAEKRMGSRNIALALGAWQGRSALGRRIESILQSSSPMNSLKAKAFVAALVLATTAGALKLGESAQLVAFTAAPVNQPALEAHQIGSRNLYREAVYHQPAKMTDAVFHAPDHEDRVLPRPTLSRHSAPHRKAVADTSKLYLLPAAQQPVLQGIPQGWLVVTRFRTFSGPQTSFTVIDRIVRISAVSAAQPSGGWYVVQL